MYGPMRERIRANQMEPISRSPWWVKSAFLVAMKWLTPFTLMLTINLEPVYGILLALAVFGDKEFMSTTFYSGAAIILATVIVNAYLKLRARRKYPQ